MSDRFEDEPGSRLPPSEGVRILGAEEAEAVLNARAGKPVDDDPEARTREPSTPEPSTPESRTSERPDDVERDGPDRGAPAATEEVGERATESDLEPVLDLQTDPPADPPADMWAGMRADDTPTPRPRRFPDEGPTWSASASEEQLLEPAPDPGGPPSEELPPLPHWTEPPSGAVPAIFIDSNAGSVDADLDAWGAAATPRFRAEGSDWAEADFADDDLTDERPRVGALAEPSTLDDDETFERDIAERRRRTPRGRAARTLVTGAASARSSMANRRAPADGSETGDRGAVGPAQSRDLPTALITAAVVALVALICFTQGTFWTVVLAAIIVALGTLEFCAGLQARGFRPASALALTAAFFLPIAAREFGSDAYPIFFALVVIFSLLWFLWEITPGRPLLGVATTVFAFAYVGGLGGFAGLLLGSPDGIGLIVGLALCVITYDVVGFFVGSQFGKSPIAPNISPNKSFEGTLAGMVAAVVMGWLFVGGALFGGIHPWSPGKGAVLGLFVAAGAFLGDLCESMLKRDLGIKDFGSLLPGHGGVLDRFDAILFCLPIAYYLSVHLNIL